MMFRVLVLIIFVFAPVVAAARADELRGELAAIPPDLGLVIVMTSDDGAPAGRTGHRDALHDLAGQIVGAVASWWTSPGSADNGG